MVKKYLEKLEKCEYRYIPIVLGSNANALGVVRSLGENKVPSIVVDSEKGIACYSKYATYDIIEDYSKNEQSFVNSLLELANELKNIKKKGIIYCCTDGYLYAVGKNYSILNDYFMILMSDWSQVEKCLDKSYLYHEAESIGVPCPKTFYAENAYEIFNCKNKLQYPILIKPAVTVGFSSVYKKAVIVNNDDELKITQKEIVELGLEKYKLIIQEIIPGPICNLYTFSSYSDKLGIVKGYSIGHKIRQSPPQTGTITSGKVVDVENISKLGIRFIKALNFHGIQNTEFKLDSRDGLFKLIEINPRPGLWNYSATAAGVNLSWIAYKNAVLDVNEGTISSKNEIIWIYDFMDLIRAVFSNKYGHKEHRISLLKWYKSVKGKKTHAIWSNNDLKPLIAFIIQTIKKR